MVRILAAIAVALLLHAGFTGSLGAQPKPPIPFAGPLYFSFPLLSQYPPLSVSMPYSVLIGYVGFDSVARRAEQSVVEQTLRNLTYSDTAKQAARFLYEMTDYDPILLFQWLNTSPTAGLYRNAPAYIRRRFTGAFDSIAPEKLNAAPLLMADYILHIHVEHTVASVDTASVYAKSAQLVTAYVVDTIKGRRIPFCLNEQFGAKNTIRPQNAAGACVNFDYRLEWRRFNHSNRISRDDSSLVDGSGNAWIKPGHEYVVFLRFASLRRDETNNYATLIPITGWGTMACMYPVINGLIYDPYDDFGYGSALTIANFKSALRRNIHTLTHP